MRQMMLSGWGKKTQERLKRTRVLVVGAGGLGCPVSLNLALAGIGHIRLCDFDVVDITNLNRQFLHVEKNIDRKKAESAQETLQSINSDVNIEPVFDKLTEDTVDDIVGDAKIILDCLDNFPTRHTLNQCAIRKGIPMVHAAIWGLEGRLTFLNPPETPCLACIFPKAPPQEVFPVLGAIACSVGSLQALDAIKYLTGVGTPLAGRMLIIDGSTMKCQELEVQKDPQCPVCGHLSS